MQRQIGYNFRKMYLIFKSQFVYFTSVIVEVYILSYFLFRNNLR
jgi:hypothetical protein